MTRTAILVAALLLLPLAAGAQTPPSTVPPPIATPVAGISVNAAATKKIPATSARIVLNFATADRALTLNKQTLQPIADAFVKSGVEPANIQWPINFNAPGGSNVASISATVTSPTAAMMQTGIVTVGTAVAAMKDVILTGATIFVTAANCQPVLSDVRRDAIAQAHEQAESIAKDLGVHIGTAVSARANDRVGLDGECTAVYGINGMPGNNASAQGPDDYLMVPVSSYVSITYAIK